LTAWKHFKTNFLLAQSESKQHYTYDYQREKTHRERADFARSSYETCALALATAFRMPVDALPAWDRLKETPEVEALCRLPLAFLQVKAPAEYRQIFERTARPMVEEDRMNAIRYALAAHLDMPPAKLSCDPADYPASKFNKLFLDRVTNRFTVKGSEYLTYHETLATGHTGKTVSQMTRAAWRRAIAHVLRAAKINETERSLDKLDALGAEFRWWNGPRCYKGRAYTWRKMVSVPQITDFLRADGSPVFPLDSTGRPASSTGTNGTPPHRSPRRRARLQAPKGRYRKGQERVTPRAESRAGRRKGRDQLSLSRSRIGRYGDR
jgi:hypothetical protein